MNDNESVKELISGLRHDFSVEVLEEGAARKDPFQQFELWLAEAIKAQLSDPNAMVLSTATESGRPSSRVVLLRGYADGGFTFFTNYDSRKAGEIDANPHAALLFFWSDISKQVRVEGTIEKAAEEISDAYFASRPRANQLGAIVSPQSRVINDRIELEAQFASLDQELSGEKIARPKNWGGYVVRPTVFEFWQGRASRLHDRLRYTKAGEDWVIERLAP